jgi:cholinesterase
MNITTASLVAANVSIVGIQTLALMSNTAGVYGEDCLNLNVWTKPQTGDAKKAVLVWIYGGGFSSGSSAVPGYNGANIAGQEDVVLVSLK